MAGSYSADDPTRTLPGPASPASDLAKACGISPCALVQLQGQWLLLLPLLAKATERYKLLLDGEKGAFGIAATCSAASQSLSSLAMPHFTMEQVRSLMEKAERIRSLSHAALTAVLGPFFPWPWVAMGIPCAAPRTTDMVKQRRPFMPVLAHLQKFVFPVMFPTPASDT